MSLVATTISSTRRDRATASNGVSLCTCRARLPLVAMAAGTVGYELLCAVAPRVPRLETEVA